MSSALGSGVIPAVASCVRRTSSAASVCDSLTPGFSRPMTRSHQFSRAVRLAQPWMSSGAALAGSQSSTARPGCTPKKPGGATPTTVNTDPFTAIVLPSTVGSPLNPACQ